MTSKIDELIDYSKKRSVDETIVLQGLIVGSTKFKKFYDTERSTIQCEIIWVFNNFLDARDHLPFGDLARINWIDDAHVIIIFKNNPPSKEEETIIAHEMAHIIIKEKGFPMVKLIDRDMEVPDYLPAQIFCLNNMIHDPLVISLLTSYGYDLCHEYSKECEEGMRLFSTFKKNPDGILLLNQTFSYVQTHLINRIIFLDEDNICQKLQDKIASIYPDLKKESDAIIRRIDRINYNTPEKVRAIYQEIINEHLGMGLFLTV